MLKQVIEMIELLDDSAVNGEKVKDFLTKRGLEDISIKEIKGKTGKTDFIKIVIPGKNGKIKGGDCPTLGIIGRLGGIGARPERIGYVSDGDGACAALSCALKLGDMKQKGDILDGDVIISTHICPNAPTEPHDPVPFMGSPVDMQTMNKMEVDPSMDAILTIDTTKGNRVFNHRGFAITPTVKDGYILRISDDLVSIMEIATGKPAQVLAITTQDITPYGNDLYHINSLMQPCTATSSPVVGVAITTETAVPGCATGASHEIDIEVTSRFALEVAKSFGRNQCKFYNEQEWERIIKLYGSMEHLKTLGRGN
ncbi:hypothetical protein TSYNTROOL_08560 [Tepidanaerobacter syntrophicus]|uniref:DUF1177 domain-containing protein n=1 Tax=Tepidanaerobacter syntrophicus TaxID=224999 RepID=UPI001BD302A8|nr:DUF1177 domain-containing protein [Tepidanaerobacter syntrophicus]GLI18696.1 hypothetical protein TSYNTROPHJE_05090 [Tepidanaerobacter syntrophicus]GLI50770.1 hypothetical protein TSYNTROOL_08560 [Tepidanaerobacter syntrophicus]